MLSLRRAPCHQQADAGEIATGNSPGSRRAAMAMAIRHDVLQGEDEAGALRTRPISYRTPSSAQGQPGTSPARRPPLGRRAAGTPSGPGGRFRPPAPRRSAGRCRVPGRPAGTPAAPRPGRRRPCHAPSAVRPRQIPPRCWAPAHPAGPDAAAPGPPNRRTGRP